MFIIDTHCHLNYLKNENNIDVIIEEAFKNNVKIINNICTNVEEFEDVLNLSSNYDNVYCSIGHHPEYSNKIKIEDFYNKDINNYKVIGIGETGLDYHFTTDFIKEQKYNFEIQIELARQTKLPLIIHSRDADKDMIDILENEMKNGEFSFLLHCFSSSKELAYKGLDLGGYISFSGILTFKNATELQNIAKNIPLDKLLIETDSPYLAPVPYRGKTNQPAYTKNILEYLSKLLNKNIDDLAEIIKNNSFNLFKYKNYLKF